MGYDAPTATSAILFHFSASHSPTTQVSFRGIISERDLRLSETPSHQLPNDLVEVPRFGPVKQDSLRDLDLAFCLFKSKIMQLRVRDVESPNTISVYLDLRRTKYICGILPGECVSYTKYVATLWPDRIYLYTRVECLSRGLVSHVTFSIALHAT